MVDDDAKLSQDKLSNFQKLLKKLLQDIGDRFANIKTVAVVLPTIQVEGIQRIYIRLLDEILVIIDIPNYLKDELSNKEINLNKCYYHIDNFYHRLYVLEEMYYRMISKIFLHGTETNRITIENALSPFGYKELNTFLSNFNKDKHIKAVRKRRKELVHRTGHSAKELVDLWSMWDGSKKHIYDQSRRSQIRFCRNEYEKISDTTVKYFTFIVKLLTVINKHLKS